MVFEPDGRLISQAEIAGFYSEDENVFQRMAHFNEDEEIYIVETNLSQKESEVVLDQTKKWVLVMQEDGQLRRMDLWIPETKCSFLVLVQYAFPAQWLVLSLNPENPCCEKEEKEYPETLQFKHQ